MLSKVLVLMITLQVINHLGTEKILDFLLISTWA